MAGDDEETLIHAQVQPSLDLVEDNCPQLDLLAIDSDGSAKLTQIIDS